VPVDWKDLMRENAANWLLQDAVSSGLPERMLVLLGNADLFDEGCIESALGPVERRGVFRVGRAHGHDVAYTTPLFGSPKVAMYLEVAAAAGVRAVVGTGYCGGIAPGAAVGTLFLPTDALALDGTTRSYGLEGEVVSPQQRLGEALTSACSAVGARSSSGRIASIDAIMLESDAMFADLRAQGVDAVDLETGCLYTLAERLGMAAAAVHIVSDNAAAGDIDEGTTHMLSQRDQIEVALRALASL